MPTEILAQEERTTPEQIPPSSELEAEEALWPWSFADAPADRPGVWSTWFFYFIGVMLLVLAIDAYRTYAKPYIQRSPTKADVDRQSNGGGLDADRTASHTEELRMRSRQPHLSIMKIIAALDNSIAAQPVVATARALA